ncbi:MAG: hypothetical protein H6Q03_1525 [Acidobacteria bacterium]|jgi:hypothetical protein|nr:hypothetical protein [Acidobacteriota bacterium]
MVQSRAKTVEAYLEELPPARREVVAAVRAFVNEHLPRGYVEGMGYGMIGWTIPLERYPSTYNGQPLCYAGLASQKSYVSLYLMSVYSSSDEEKWLRAEFKRAGKKLDMGKCCVRFRKVEDLELSALGRILAGTPPDDFIAMHEAARRKTAKKK